MVLGLATCRAPPPPVRQAEFAPPPPTKPTDRPPICGQSEEVDAVHIVGLQTQLMQIALSCGGDDKYNVFVKRFQPQLAKQRDILSSYFTRAYGRGRSQTAYDQYVTQLADSESAYNLASGGDFCSLSKGDLDQAKALLSADDLSRFIAKVPVQQPTDFEVCGTPGAPPAFLQTKSLKHRRRRHRDAAG